MKRIAVWIMLITIPSISNSGQTNAPLHGGPGRGSTEGAAAREVREVKRLYDVATLKNDGGWFRRVFAEDYVWIGPDGSVVTKAEYVRDVESRDITWASVAVKDMQVRVYGDTAVATGRFFGKGRYKGKPLDERQRFTTVLLKRNTQWEIITEHCSKLNTADE